METLTQLRIFSIELLVHFNLLPRYIYIEILQLVVFFQFPDIHIHNNSIALLLMKELSHVLPSVSIKVYLTFFNITYY